MTADSDSENNPDKKEKAVGAEGTNNDKTSNSDGSALTSQNATNPKPFMIYPIPRAGKIAETEQIPEGMTYEQVLAVNSPVRMHSEKADMTVSPAGTSVSTDVPATSPESHAQQDENNQPQNELTHAIDSAANSNNVQRRPERVARTLIDFVVPQADKLDSDIPKIASQTTEPVGLDPASESSASVLHRIKDSRAINHEKAAINVSPPEVPPSMRRKRGATRTMLDILVDIGNQLTGAGHAPELAPELASRAEAGLERKELQGKEQERTGIEQTTAVASEEHPSHTPEYYSNESHYPVSDYSDIGEPQIFYQGADGGVVTPIEEHRGEGVSRTLLDHSVLFDTVSKSAEKMILKAAEEQKNILQQPFIPFIPVQADRLSSACPWKWEGEEGKDRVRYCGNCKRQVYNFSGIERPEAEALIFKHENQVAKTLFKRADGKFMTTDCPVAVKQARGMVLTVVIGMFFVLICITGMLLVPHDPQAATSSKSATSTSGSSSSSGSSSQSGSYDPYDSTVRSRRSRSGSSTNSSSAGQNNQGVSPSNGISVSGQAAQPPVTPAPPANSASAPIGANGGYGPIGAPASTVNDYQWQYGNDAQKNPAPVASPNVTPAPSQVTPAQAAELQRLKQQLIDSSK